jgi:hypothetical protein
VPNPVGLPSSYCGKNVPFLCVILLHCDIHEAPRMHNNILLAKEVKDMSEVILNLVQKTEWSKPLQHKRKCFHLQEKDEIIFREGAGSKLLLKVFFVCFRSPLICMTETCSMAVI